MMPAPDSHELAELLDEFRHANEVFHRKREEWEHWLAANEFRHDERVDAARADLRQAEQQVERVEDRIRKALPH
jgi:hypothetical protein